MAKQIRIVLGDTQDNLVDDLDGIIQTILTMAGLNCPTFVEDVESEGEDEHAA